MKKKVSVLGDGAFGTAFAQLIALKGHEVSLWCYNKFTYESIKKTGINDIYLPEIKLDSKIIPTTNIQESINSSDIIFEAIPAQYLKQTLLPVAELLDDKIVCVLTKGIETDSLYLPSKVIENIVKQKNGSLSKFKTVIISGPSFARDIALLSPTGLTLSSNDKNALELVSNVLPGVYLELTDDTMGVQVSGAVQNVIALGVGILDGAGFLDNTKALFFYRSLDEIKTLIKHFGGKPESVYLLSGIGDLVLTAFMSQGRNKRVGFDIGRGKKICDILNQVDFVPEGANTLKSINELIEKNNLDLPICQAIYNIVYNDFKIETLISKLF